MKITFDTENEEDILKITQFINNIKDMNRSVKLIGLSPRSYNALYYNGIKTLEDLLNQTEVSLLKVQGIELKTFSEIILILKKMGYELKIT